MTIPAGVLNTFRMKLMSKLPGRLVDSNNGDVEPPGTVLNCIKTLFQEASEDLTADENQQLR